MRNLKTILRLSTALCLIASIIFAPGWISRAAASVVDSGQNRCYDNYSEIPCPGPGQPFYGQDAQYGGNPPSYRDNGDGTVSDLKTGLTWSKSVDARKVSLVQAEKIARGMTLGGWSDWRVPTIKELYALIDFRGNTGFSRFGASGDVPSNAIPFINTDYFDFAYGDVSNGERFIDAQWLSCTKYVSTTMGVMETLFGVNFADGRIKGYGYKRSGGGREMKKFYVRFVRGEPYGANHFVDNGDGTVTDLSTGLMWMKTDNGKAMSWKAALSHAQRLSYAGFDDWRLPNAKELQYIVDYSRSPDSAGSPAIDPVFRTTAIANEAGQTDYPYFWTSTTHLDGPDPGAKAAYIAFGRALGEMRGRIMDVHGAGAQRSDPKTGQAGLGYGPQGDARRITNFVRCVRGVQSPSDPARQASTDKNRYPNKVSLSTTISGSASRRLRPEGVNRQPRGSEAMPGPRRGRKGFVTRLDRNGDGKVSRLEFDGPPDRFDFHDADHDGFLSEEEAPKGPPPGARHSRSSL